MTSWSSRLFRKQISRQPETTSTSPRRIIREKEEALLLLSQNRDNVWSCLDVALQHDREVVFVALTRKLITLSQLAAAMSKSSMEEENDDVSCGSSSSNVLDDPVFWKQLVEYEEQWWDQLPASLRRSNDFNTSLTAIHSARQLKSIVQNCPSVATDVSFWSVVASRGLATADALVQYADESILQTKSVMLIAVQHDYVTYDVLEAPLNRDADIVAAALSQSIVAVVFMPAFVQEVLFPGLVAKAIRRHGRNPQFTGWVDFVAQGLWYNRDIVVSWVSIGGDWRREFSSFRNDEEIFLLVAQHNWDEFSIASPNLKMSKAFMMKVVGINGFLLSEAVYPLNMDFDLALEAFCTTDDLIDSYDETDPNDSLFLDQLYDHFSAKLSDHKNFLLVLCGMTKDQNCTLCNLNLGPDTSKAFRQRISGYMGDVAGSEISKMRQAMINLTRRRVNR